MLPEQTSSQIGASARQLTGFCKALSHLSTTGIERLTVVQALFFTLIAKAEARGHQLTLADIFNAHGDDLNKSVKNTDKVLLEKSRQYPDGLGWLTRIPNPDDELENFLRLTPFGCRVVEKQLDELNGGLTN